MSLISTIKSILGVGDAERSDEGTTVTVERDPDVGPDDGDGSAATDSVSTHAEDEPTVGADDGDDGAGADDEGAAADDVAAEPSDEGEPVETINGIGPAYAERLAEAGVESTADLAAADAAELAEATDISETRISGWIDDARSG